LLTFHSTSLAETKEVAWKLLPYIRPGFKCAVIGPMGAGKSYLIRSILDALGISGEKPSPTYTLVNTYLWEHEGKETLIHHSDLYRLSDLSEVESIGMDEMLNDSSILFAEWADKFPLLFTGSAQLVIKPTGSDSREITLTGI
jgi:tRNA threonylcarbamoyladenosine biosynthesis protein TsaE